MNQIRTIRLLAAAAALGLAAASAIGQASGGTASAAPAKPVLQQVHAVEGITEYRLPNGLQVLLVPDDSKPTTTVNLTVRVGSRHENYGETGMAHLLEHLIFKGSARHPNAWAEFMRRGLRSNGTTWLDRTNYFASFAENDENLAWLIDWLGDALVNSFIARKDLDTEMTVVRNEMETGENNPGNILFEKTLAAMYQWHNYGKSTIGARADVEGVDIARLQAFYRTWYQPDNATLIVSGRFDPARAQALVIEHFGRIPRPQRELPRLYTLDPAQDGEREVTVRRVGGAPSMMVGYHSVPAAHPDHPAAEMLGVIMGEAPAGRLHRRLTQKGLAASTWGWVPMLHDPGLMAFGVELGPGQDPAAARAALIEALESVEREPITQEELQRAQLRWLKAWEQAFSDPEEVGVGLSESIALGDWRLSFLLRDRVRDLKLADVQRVATQRLIPANRTLGTFLPTTQPVRAPAPAAVDVAAQMQGFKPQAGAGQAEAFDVSPANVDARTQRSRLGGVQVALLPKTTRGQVVSATLRLRVGDLASLTGEGSVGAMMASMLDKGGGGLSRQQIQDRLDALRSELSFGYRSGVLTASLLSRREHLPAALELTASLLRRPAFEQEVLDELKRQALAANEQARQEPGDIAGNAIWRHGNPYPKGHPLHERTFDEQAQDIRSVTVERLQRFHARFVGAGTAEFAAVGDLDPVAVRAVIERSLAGWASPMPARRIEDPLWPSPPVRLAFNTPDKQNAVLLVRQPLPLNDAHPDAPALTLANMILGSGGNSRLWVRLREKGGLSYDVRSWIDWNAHEPHSVWQASATFAPENLGKVEAAFREEVALALKSGFTAQELQDAKAGLLNLRRLSRAQDGSLARLLASNLYLGRTMAWSAALERSIQAATLAQVNAALVKYLKPESFVIGVGGDFKAP
ncbi:MAG: M16 family metallopeptidase [Rubrivivax sp.]